MSATISLVAFGDKTPNNTEIRVTPTGNEPSGVSITIETTNGIEANCSISVEDAKALSNALSLLTRGY